MEKKGEKFWRKIRFKYRISVFNENTLEEVWRLRLSRLRAFAYISVFSALLVFFTSIIIVKTPISNLLPGHLNNEMRERIIVNALTLDSLQWVSDLQANYLNHVGAMLKGEVELDPIRPIDSVVWKDFDSIQKSQREQEFVKKFEEEERTNLSVSSQTPAADELMLIFTKPVKGEVNESAVTESGIDIAVTTEQPVLASQQGIVVYAGYDIEKRYVIQIQHEMGFLTSYMQVSNLLKKTGDKVNTGEAIAMIRGGTTTTPVIFHFGLWQNGKRLNPAEYIVF